MKADTKIDVAKKKGEFYNAQIILSDGTTWLYNAEKYLDEWTIVFYTPVGKTQPTENKGKIALETFAAVERLTKEFIEYQKPERFSFSGGGRSRNKLYDLLAKKIVKTKKYKMKKDKGLMSDFWEFERI